MREQDRQRRLRLQAPLHTSVVVFAFGGNVLIATSFYVVQKTCRARLAGDLAPWFVVVGYNFFEVICP